MTIKKITAISIFLLTFSILSGQEEEDKTLLLKIGKKRKGKKLPESKL